MTKKHFFLYIMTFALLLTGTGSLTGCRASNQKIVKSGFYFNTIISVTIYDASKEHLLEECFQLADMYEGYFSTTIPDSDIAKINASAGTPVEVHDETIDLLELGIYYGKLSNGKFDITIGKLSDLWDFSTKALIEDEQMSEAYLPSASAIEKALATVDYSAISIDGNTVTLKNPESAIDLGGIAKGYIADQMKAFLNENGVTSGIINLGGNVLTLGAKANGDSYTIGIQKPFSEDGSAIASVQITDKTVVSSGIYERYFEVNGQLYHHILDTVTGYPYENNLLEVTIITDSSANADALSTTCFSLGLEEGLKLIESLENTEAILITDDYEIHTTSGIGTTIPFQKLGTQP